MVLAQSQQTLQLETPPSLKMPKSYTPISPYMAAKVPEPVLTNSARLQSLVRDGKLYVYNPTEELKTIAAFGEDPVDLFHSLTIQRIEDFGTVDGDVEDAVADFGFDVFKIFVSHCFS